MSRGWMPLYVGDYLRDTGHLSTLEHGAYLLLIMHYWQNGGLPNDDAKLARICRLSKREWAASRETLAAFFSEGWKHKRIDGELAAANAVSGKAREKANKRWGRGSEGSGGSAGGGAVGDAGADASADTTAHPTADARADATAMPVEAHSICQSQSHIGTDLHQRAAIPGTDERVAALRMRLVKIWEKNNIPSLPPDTGIAAVWVSRGYDPAMVEAVITARFPRGRRPPRSWNYFDDAIAEEYDKRRAANGAAPSALEAPDITPERAERWAALRADKFISNDEWRDAWGPRPGEPGCDLTDALLAATAAKYGRTWPDDWVRH